MICSSALGCFASTGAASVAGAVSVAAGAAAAGSAVVAAGAVRTYTQVKGKIKKLECAGQTLTKVIDVVKTAADGKKTPDWLEKADVIAKLVASSGVSRQIQEMRLDVKDPAKVT